MSEEPKGPRIDDVDEHLFRQIHPSFMQEGRPSSQAFHPTPKDDGLLSVSASSKTTAEAAHKHYTGPLGKASAAVYAVTVHECATCGRAAYYDEITSPPDPHADPAHSVIDFRDLGPTDAKRVGKRLAQLARDRGHVYKPEEARQRVG